MADIEAVVQIFERCTPEKPSIPDLSEDKVLEALLEEP